MDLDKRRYRRIIRSQNAKPAAYNKISLDMQYITHEQPLMDKSIYRKIYTNNACYNIDWKRYADHIYIIRTEESCPAEDLRYSDYYDITDDIRSVVVPDYDADYRKVKDPYKDAFVDILKDCRQKGYDRIMVLSDEFYLNFEDIIKPELENGMDSDVMVLNNCDVGDSNVILSSKAVQSILDNNSLLNHNPFRINKVCGELPIYSNAKIYVPDNVVLIHPVDYIVPYVDGTVPRWQELYTKHTGRKIEANMSRFRSFDNLRYHFRGVEKYMPFVRDIVLIVQDETQVPSWVNMYNTHIVYHDQFIPNEFLPTFSSCTIESFLYNIKGVSEYTIYSNDDCYPINDMKYSDFFINGIPQFEVKSASGTSIYRCQCRNSHNMASYEFGKESDTVVIKPTHIAHPILRRCMRHIYNLNTSKIRESISLLRERKNINQYVYVVYQTNIFGNTGIGVKYLYKTFDNGVENIVRIINGKDVKMICINDSGSVNFNRDISRINSTLKQKLNECGRFEKSSE